MAELIAFSGQGYRLDCNQVVGPEQQEIDLDSHIVRDADREGQPGQHDEDREGQLGQHDEDREGQLGQRDEVSCAQPSPTLVEGSNDESKGDAKTKEAVQANVEGLRSVAQRWVVILENATACGQSVYLCEIVPSILNLARKFVVDCTDLLDTLKDLDLDEANFHLVDMRCGFDLLRQMMEAFRPKRRRLSVKSQPWSGSAPRAHLVRRES